MNVTCSSQKQLVLSALLGRYERSDDWISWVYDGLVMP
ncbi:hypothetical protein HMPREF1043_1183 [Streptococcus anginosus subsp. whileyi CCUG 39159]|uniref:Uncharacterized protein n=1 Tax=Streptococcus anginosus subsp. whileyi CCUG 39159 TaxID=1095729 RepID=I0SHX7_STRAP|nr:hypothetical protein SanJ4211_0775 [Streptococcus anginosus]EID22980.1 hypothetical protein HMPREF1043_1183 [Streptococcus anginosus subsp. whileyi CCUG 39159]